VLGERRRKPKRGDHDSDSEIHDIVVEPEQLNAIAGPASVRTW